MICIFPAIFINAMLSAVQNYSMKTLKLTLTKQWFDMVKDGIKTEEYREIKQYWIKRITGGYVVNVGTGQKIEDNGAYNAIANNLQNIKDAKKWQPNKFDRVEFTNGYSPKSPKITFECLSIEYGKGKQEWGAEINKYYFVIKVGREVSRLNC